MLGELNETQIDNLLVSQVVGRIACCSNMKPYIVPVTYVFDGKYIYGQTKEGMKLDVLRKNPMVCFEIDVMTDMANWQSVVIWGTFQELQASSAEKAREYLFNRVLPLMTSSTIHPNQHEVTAVIDDSNRLKPIMYQIEITEKWGRFERR